MPVANGSKKTGPARGVKTRKKKRTGNSLHGHGVQASVNERVEDLARRYPALRSSLGLANSDDRKRIRDFPLSEQARILRMVFALKMTLGG